MTYNNHKHSTHAHTDVTTEDQIVTDLLLPVHEKARYLFFQSEWPSKSNDEYRRTDLSTFPFTRFTPGQTMMHIHKGNVTTENLLSTEPSSIPTESTPDNPIISSLMSPEKEAVTITSDTLLRDLQSANNRVQFWHFANIDSGCTIIAREQKSQKEPVFVEYTFSREDALYNPHTIIHAKDGSEVSVVIVYRSTTDAPHCVNAGVSVTCGNHAVVNLTEIQILNSNATFFSHGSTYCLDGSVVKRNDISLGGKLVKTRFSSAARGRHVNIELKGLFISSQDQHQDIRIVQRHESGQSKSHSLYRGLVRDQGRSIFQGMISVDRNAGGTDAYLSNDNLVLNDGARADSIPALHIDTNDVRCSHGSTTGKLDKNKLFYLMNRGLNEQQARDMLIAGFFEKITGELPPETADFARSCIEKKLSGSQSSDVKIVLREP